MDREYFYKKQRQLEQDSLVSELKKRQDNVEYHLRKNPSVSYDKIPNMTRLQRKVQTGKHKDNF